MFGRLYTRSQYNNYPSNVKVQTKPFDYNKQTKCFSNISNKKHNLMKFDGIVLNINRISRIHKNENVNDVTYTVIQDDHDKHPTYLKIKKQESPLFHDYINNIFKNIDYEQKFIKIGNYVINMNRIANIKHNGTSYSLKYIGSEKYEIINGENDPIFYKDLQNLYNSFNNLKKKQYNKNSCEVFDDIANNPEKYSGIA